MYCDKSNPIPIAKSLPPADVRDLVLVRLWCLLVTLKLADDWGVNRLGEHTAPPVERLAPAQAL